MDGDGVKMFKNGIKYWFYRASQFIKMREIGRNKSPSTLAGHPPTSHLPNLPKKLSVGQKFKQTLFKDRHSRYFNFRRLKFVKLKFV